MGGGGRKSISSPPGAKNPSYASGFKGWLKGAVALPSDTQLAPP